MRQRVMIAMALACKPDAADRRRADHGARRHDPGADPRADAGAAAASGHGGDPDHARSGRGRARRPQRVIVMYAGRRSRRPTSTTLFAEPRHPYTRGLMASIPAVLDGASAGRGCAEIPGTVPSLDRLPPGCAFAPRCALAIDRCRQEQPPLQESADPSGAHAGALRKRWRCLTDAPLLEVNDLIEALSGAKRRAPPQGRHRACRRRRELLARAPARRWGWSANPAAASRRGARVLRLVEPTIGRVAFEGQDITALSKTRAAARSARRCRSSSRTRSPRSIRA